MESEAKFRLLGSFRQTSKRTYQMNACGYQSRRTGAAALSFILFRCCTSNGKTARPRISFRVAAILIVWTRGLLRTEGTRVFRPLANAESSETGSLKPKLALAQRCTVSRMHGTEPQRRAIPRQFPTLHTSLPTQTAAQDLSEHIVAKCQCLSRCLMSFANTLFTISAADANGDGRCAELALSLLYQQQ